MPRNRLYASFLAIALILGGTTVSANSAHAFEVRTREQVVQDTTDALIYQLYPDLKLRADSYKRIREISEWHIIREIIDEQGLAYQKLNPKVNDSNWYWKYDDEVLKESLADAIFHYRHRERKGKPIQIYERAAIREWNALKRAMWFPTN